MNVKSIYRKNFTFQWFILEMPVHDQNGHESSLKGHATESFYDFYYFNVLYQMRNEFEVVVS